MFITAEGLSVNDGAHVLNGRGYGDAGSMLGQVRFEPGLLRPYIETNPSSRLYGQATVVVNVGRRWNPEKQAIEPSFKKFRVVDLTQRGIMVPTFLGNATTLLKETWIEVDRAVNRATRPRLRAWTDLVNSSSRGGFNAMARMTLEYQAMTDPGEAIVDMDAISEGRNDQPLFTLRSIPLPITHSDFEFSARLLAVSRNGEPLDLTMAEAGGRRVAESVEKTLIGVETGMTYGTQTAGVGTHEGTSTVWGYTNFPYRVTKTDLTTPLGTNPEAVMTDILEMVETMQTNGFYGPYILYHSTGYSRYLSDDYFRTGSTSAVRSLRQRLLEIEGIQDIRRLDYLTSGFQLILVQMDSMVAQAINGMDITTVQWESKGGLAQHFKVMAIQVPLLRAPYNGVGGIIHGTTA